MKKIRNILTLLLCAAVAFATVACSGKTDGDVVAVTLETTQLSMKTGDAYKLGVTVEPAGQALTWASDDSKVVSVAGDGTVRALQAGSAVVSVTAGRHSDYCQITVSDGTSDTVDDEVKDEKYIYREEFDDRTSVPNYLRTNVSGGGALSVQGGAMQLRTEGNGIAFATYVFDEALSGKIVAEAGVKVSSRSFSNILFFYRGEQGFNNDDIIACLGMDAGQFKNHDGGGWGNIGLAYSTDTWYNIRMELDIGAGRYDLYIDGRKFSRLPFRKTGDGVEDRIKLLKFGTDKENANLTYDYIRISQGSDQSAPELETSRTTYRIGLDATDRVVLDYTTGGNPRPTVSLTPDGNNPAGASIADDKRTITFAPGSEGTYKFTLSAENELGTATKQITVIVGADSSALLETDFSTVPDGMTFTANNGAAVVEDGRLVMTTNASGSVLTQARYDFGEALTGKVRASLTVTVGTNAFSNILFLYHTGTTGFVASNCTNSIAVEKGILKYNSGGWKDIAPVTLGTAFELAVVFDFDNHTFDLWLNNEKKLTGASMRKSSGDTGVLIIGSDKVDTSMVYDSLSFVKEA